MTDEAKRPMADGMNGWVLVPKNPTWQMSDAGWMVEQHQNTAWRLICHEVYGAMLAAAPAHPASEAVARLVDAARKFMAITNPQFPGGSATTLASWDVERARAEFSCALAPFLPKESGGNDASI